MDKHQKDTYLKNSLINGDKEGIVAIYKLVFPKVLTFVFQNKGQEQDAKDVFQKVLLQISARIAKNKFSTSSSFEGYLFTSCKNLWRRELNKKNRVTKSGVVELTSEEYDLGLATVEIERWDLFREKLQALTDNCRRLLEFSFQKMPYVEIAEKLEYSSENVVRQRIFKCKKRLTDIIQRDPRFKKLQ